MQQQNSRIHRYHIDPHTEPIRLSVSLEHPPPLPSLPLCWFYQPGHTEEVPSLCPVAVLQVSEDKSEIPLELCLAPGNIRTRWNWILAPSRLLSSTTCSHSSSQARALRRLRPLAMPPGLVLLCAGSSGLG